MNDAMRPDPDEQAFAESLRGGFTELRDRRGACPSPEELVAFFESRLPVEDASRVQAHIEACGLCDVALGRLKGGGADNPNRSALESVWAFVRSPIVAYCLAALLLYPAYRGAVPGRNAISSPVPAEILPKSAPRFSLDAVRSDSNPRAIRVSQDQDLFILSFLISVRSGFHYSAVIGDSTGKPIAQLPAIIPSDDLGNSSLVCSRRLFAPGLYTLAVTEMMPGAGPTDRQLIFQFVVEE